LGKGKDEEFPYAACLGVQVAFASDGEVSWTEPGEVSPVFQGETALRISADLMVADRSIGLIARPAYQRFLGEQVKDQVRGILIPALDNAAR
jgi:hypothetical protein